MIAVRISINLLSLSKISAINLCISSDLLYANQWRSPNMEYLLRFQNKQTNKTMAGSCLN